MSSNNQNNYFYKITELDFGVSQHLEQLGTKAKFWFSQDGIDLMFKAERLGSGEHWSEKACCEIAKLLGLPHAEYDLATHNGEFGVVTPKFLHNGARLILANELFAQVTPGYDGSVTYRARGHTLSRAIAVLSMSQVGLPINWQSPEALKTPLDVFAGYLLLDALVSNQDRHHENWGMIFDSRYGISLAPTFDHASSLGRNETDERRSEMMHTSDAGRSVARYVARARSAFYRNETDSRPLSTLEAFALLYQKINGEAAEYWLDKLCGLEPADLCEIMSRVPDSLISQLARDFACEMMNQNRARIISEIS